MCYTPLEELERLQWLKVTAGFYWQRRITWSWVGIAAAALLVNQSSVCQGNSLQGNVKTSVCTLPGHNQTLIQEHCDAGKVKRDTLN